MYKYINLKSVLLFVPDVIIEQTSEAQMLSWAMQGYRENFRSANITYDETVYADNIVDNKITLPEEIVYVAEVGLISNNSDYYLDLVTNLATLLDADDKRLFIQQELLYNTSYTKNAQTLRYKGQNPQLLINNCVNFKSECEIGFSVSKDMRTITFDIEEGFAYCFYKTRIKDGKNFLIPDDDNLKRSLGYFVQAMYFMNRSARGVQNAENMFQSRLRMCTEKKEEFFSNHFMENLNVELHTIKHHSIMNIPHITGKNRNRNYG